MGEKTVKAKRPKRWGEEGFESNISYGCYHYKVIFLKQDDFQKYVDI